LLIIKSKFLKARKIITSFSLYRKRLKILLSLSGKQDFITVNEANFKNRFLYRESGFGSRLTLRLSEHFALLSSYNLV
jgi:hypothetical protein